jgi:hypothetical protein
MIKFATMLVAGAFALALAPVSLAQDVPGALPPEPETRRAPDSGEVDKPTPPVRIVVPMPEAGDPYSGDQEPTPESEMDAPPEEILEEPPTEIDEPPTFFGEPVSGNFVWVLDRSGSMSMADSGSGPIEDANGNILVSPNRMQIVKSECIRVLTQLREEDQFAIISFGANPDVTYYQALVPATSGNVQQGIATVNALVASGMTPAYPALLRACQQYGTELDKMYFLCDGGPNQGGGAAQILADFPGWYQGLRDAGCELVCVHIGNSGSAASFMQALANQNGGTYIHK